MMVILVQGFLFAHYFVSHKKLFISNAHILTLWHHELMCLSASRTIPIHLGKINDRSQIRSIRRMWDGYDDLIGAEDGVQCPREGLGHHLQLLHHGVQQW
jgi:hypothetical protein